MVVVERQEASGTLAEVWVGIGEFPASASKRGVQSLSEPIRVRVLKGRIIPCINDIFAPQTSALRDTMDPSDEKDVKLAEQLGQSQVVEANSGLVDGALTLDPVEVNRVRRKIDLHLMPLMCFTYMLQVSTQRQKYLGIDADCPVHRQERRCVRCRFWHPQGPRPGRLRIQLANNAVLPR